MSAIIVNLYNCTYQAATVLSLYIFGGAVLKGFSFALVVGILIGTYSSIAVAAPMLVAWQEWRAKQGKTVVLPAAKRSKG